MDSKRKVAAALAAGAMLAHPGVIAGDIAREVQQRNFEYGSFAELGVMVAASSLPLIGFNDQSLEKSGDDQISLHIGLQGRFEYKRFFIEAIDDSFSNVTLGINIKSTENYSLDILGTQSFDGVERNEEVGFESISDRDGDFGLGFRNSFYRGDNIFQYEIVADTSGAHDGIMVAFQYGRQFQYRNWNFHSLLGVRYFSDKVMDHYFGVSEQESTATLESYEAKDGFLPSVLFGATLPLSEKWLFKAVAEYSRLPESVIDSPLAQGDDMYLVQAGFYRVLYP